MTYPTMQHIPLTSAYLCPDCNSIGNNPLSCPACAGTALMNLASVLDRDVEAGPMTAYSYPMVEAGYPSMVH